MEYAIKVLEKEKWMCEKELGSIVTPSEYKSTWQQRRLELETAIQKLRGEK